MRALILAAGLGTRLRPLTNFIPKPLILFFGQPILDIVYYQIRQAGIGNIAINTHHLAPLISHHVKASLDVYTEHPIISFEPEILGTGGAINPIRPWLGEDSLLIYNGDVIADIELKKLVDFHLLHKHAATMVLLDHHKKDTTPVYTDHGRIAQIGLHPSSAQATGRQVHTFSGIHILSSKLLKYLNSIGSFSVIEAYQSALLAGESIGAFIHGGFWEDLGTPKDYYQAHLKLFQEPLRDKILMQFGFERSNYQESNIYWDTAQTNAFCGISPFANQAKRTFFFDQIDPDLRLDSCIVYPHSHLTRQESYTNRVITQYCQLKFE